MFKRESISKTFYEACCLTLVTSILFMSNALAKDAIANNTDSKDKVEASSNADTDINDDAVIITASRTAQTTNETLASVTVITRDELDASQASDIVQVLQSKAGISIARTGGPGSSVSLYMRGTENNHTLVLIDGVRVSSATTGSFAWANLSPNDIERIEIVRGPRAAQYGSDAIGGVIQIFTRQNTSTSLRAKFGSYNTRMYEFGTGGKSGIATYSFNISSRAADGFSSTNNKNSNYNPDNDPYRNNSLSGRISLKASDATNLTLTHWQSSSDTNYDQGVSVKDNVSTSLNLTTQTTNIWEQQFSLGLALDEIDNVSSFPSFIRTRRETLEWNNDIAVTDNILVTGGLSSVTEDTFNQNTSTNAIIFDDKTRNKAAYLSGLFYVGEHDFQLSSRVDDHSSFGTHTTGQAAWGYQINQQSRFYTSYGTGFKAPTANELFHPGFGGFFAGNSALLPEESTSFEIGLKNKFSEQNVEVSIYNTDIDNLISYSGTNSQAVNVNKSNIQGIELTHTYFGKGWNLQSQYTHLKAINKDTRKDLLRRPRDTASAIYSQKFDNDASFNIEWIYSSESEDISSKKNASYYLVNLSERHKITENLWFEGRLDNLFNTDYETAFGYNQPGRSLYLGIKLDL